jgi:uncharacterized protein YdaU (DUF1376 family)
MSKLPSMPLFCDAYLADTAHLTLEESGAYMHLLMAMWRNGGSIPDDDVDNARMCKVGLKKWRKLKVRLMPFLQSYGPVDNLRLTQGRLSREWNRVAEYRSAQSVRGEASARSRFEQKQLLNSNRRSFQSSTKSQPELNTYPYRDISTSSKDAGPKPEPDKKTRGGGEGTAGATVGHTPAAVAGLGTEDAAASVPPHNVNGHRRVPIHLRSAADLTREVTAGLQRSRGKPH